MLAVISVSIWLPASSMLSACCCLDRHCVLYISRPLHLGTLEQVIHKNSIIGVDEMCKNAARLWTFAYADKPRTLCNVESKEPYNK